MSVKDGFKFGVGFMGAMALASLLKLACTLILLALMGGGPAAGM